MLWVGFVLAFLSSVALVPLVRKLSIKLGKVSRPREDRWHRKPTPALGGIGIFLSFAVSLLAAATINSTWDSVPWGMLAGSLIIFLLGLYDDLYRISPPAKLVGQILAAALVIFLGYTTRFFTPRLADTLLAQLPNIALTFFWLVGITNAINLLDNMDGLAGGISLVTAGFLAYFAWTSGDQGLLIISLSLAGGVLGFLVFNFPPASIFMGDSGSLFLGFTLAATAIARAPRASNVFAVMGVPTLLFLLPILDTTLVTITRLLRGQSPAQGGKDHTSHRLIAFGLSERQAVLVLYGGALLAGLMGVAVESLEYWLSLVLVPVVVLGLALTTAYLGRLKVVPPQAVVGKQGTFTRLMVELTFKRRFLEILMDFLMIGLAFYLAFLTSYGSRMNETRLSLYLSSLPLALAVGYLSLFWFGVYRGVWRYVGLGDLVNYLKAALGTIALLSAVIYLFPNSLDLPTTTVVTFGVYLFLGLAATRSSFRLMDQAYARRGLKQEFRVLVLGAGDAGEMAVRWMLMNPEMGYHPVGFLDNDSLITGRAIHGVEILGTVDDIGGFLESRAVEGVILTGELMSDQHLRGHVLEVCQSRGCWVRSLRLEFEPVER